MSEAMNKCILVLGDLMVDHYLWGAVDRISPEAPVPVVLVNKESSNLGGAGNVVNNLLAFGCRVAVGGMVGCDEGGDYIHEEFLKRKVNTDALLRKRGYQTIKKSRLMAEHNHVVRFDRESVERISETEEDWFISAIMQNLDTLAAIILSDYGKGLLTERLCRTVIKAASEKSIPVIIDPKGTDYSKYRGATLVTPNRKEASMASNIEIHDDSSLLQAGRFLRESLELDAVVITLSRDGMAYFNEHEFEKIPAIAKDVFDVTGAGDTVIASLVYSLLNGGLLRDCCVFANRAAAIVVGKLGPATASLQEIEELNAVNYCSTEKVIERKRLPEILKKYREKSKKIVFTNGCFDILHSGHVFYLNKAAKFGDILIVGLNSDASVKRLKGPSRPIFTQDERASVLSALQMVDHVVIFSEDTPERLIHEIQPDVLVKGGDYVREQIVGYTETIQRGGTVEVIDFIEGKSTSGIIDRIRAN